MPHRAAASGSTGVRSVLVDVAGITLRVESNAAEVLERAESRFAPAMDATAGCALRVTLRDELLDGPPTLTWAFPSPDRLTVAMHGLRARVDLHARQADAEVHPSFIDQRALFQRCILEGIPFSMLTRCDRLPVHAAALRNGDAGLLLRAASGVGKSTLVYAAHRAGLAVLADDACRVQLAPALRVWGDTPGPRLHLLDEARDRFPELRGRESTWMSANGLKLEVALPWSEASPPFVRRARVCLLRRDAGTARPVLRRATPREVSDSLTAVPDSRLEMDPGAVRRMAAALTAEGGWLLELSQDPADAVPYLREMLEETAAG